MPRPCAFTLATVFRKGCGRPASKPAARYGDEDEDNDDGEEEEEEEGAGGGGAPQEGEEMQEGE